MKRFSIITILIMFTAVSMVFATGGRQATTGGGTPTLSPAGLTGDALAFSRFTSPVDVHIGMEIDPTDTTLPPGDTPQNNQYTRYLRDKYNINIIVDWTAGSANDYRQRVALAIASNSMPDSMIAPTHIHMLQAAKAGMLYDITNLFNQYASSQVKSIMATTEGRALQSVSYQDRMIALPNITVDTDGVYVLNVQKNWLDQYNLAVPRTLDDIENIARVFRDRQPAGAQTVPIVGPDRNTRLYGNFMESSNQGNTLAPVFFANDAYPGFFLDNGNGTVSYGSLSPNMRPALERLARWYRERLLDPEIGTRERSSELIDGNRGGIRFGPWWGLGYGNGDSFRNDPNVNWQSYPVYSNDGRWNTTMKAVGTTACLINTRASANTAAAIIIMYNALVRDEATFDTSVAIGWFPLRTVAAPADECEYTYQELTKILQGRANPTDYNDPLSPYKLINADARMIRNVIPGYSATRELSVSDFNQSNRGDFQRAYALMIGNRPYATTQPDKKVYSVTYAMTDLLEQHWPNLFRMEEEVMLRIITGQADISAFDRFVNDWRNQGGQGILDDLANQFLR
jgi:multiple sugar transport system substrate-binding protein/putative aldouronate transport system substrate-binding protein